MPGLRELLKRVLYKISPVYRNLLYLRFELENIDSRLKLMQEKQNNLEEFNYKMIVEKYLKKGYNEYEAQVEALMELVTKFDIMVKEVTEDGM